MNIRHATLLSLVLLAGSAFGQPGQPLGGPNAADHRPPVGEQGFDGGPVEQQKRWMADRGIPMPEYVAMINSLKGDTTPANLKLTAEQDKQIQSLGDAFRKEADAFREKMRSQRQDQGAGPADKNEREAMRSKMEEMRAAAPKPSETQTKMWAVLTPEQQKQLQPQLDRVRADVENRRAEEMANRRNGKRGPGAQGGPGGAGGAFGPGGERGMKIMQRLRALSPEDREKVLNKLEEELNKVDGGAAGAPAQNGQPVPPRPRLRARPGNDAPPPPPPPQNPPE
jgi:Spy/CpxP family protein refolding chaperone